MKKRLIAGLAAVLMATVGIGCSKNKTPEWTDTVPRPEISTPEIIGGYVKYPDAPANAPADADTTRAPAVTGYESHGKYTVEKDGDTFVAEYEDLDDWDYIYASIDNYHGEYSNFKMTLGVSGSERIAIQAIYYEMYSQNRRAVTVYQGDLAAGERYVIAQFGKLGQTNDEYQPISETLKEAKIIGLAIFIDSNPAQLAVSDRAGKVTFKGVEFLKDGDPELDEKYVVPSANWDGTHADTGYTVEKLADDEENITSAKISYNGIGAYSRVYVPIVDYSSDYAEFSIKLDTRGVKGYSIGIMFSTEGHDNWQPYVDLVKVTAATDGVHEHTLNFDGTAPVDMGSWLPVGGELVKNYRVYEICIWFDSLDGMDQTNSGTATVSDVKFNRTATEGATVGKAWVSDTPNIVVGDDVDIGGVGTITYTYYPASAGWFKVSMPVSSYEPKTKLTMKFTTDDPIDYMGIAVIANGQEVTINSGWDKFETGTKTDETNSDANGSVRTISKIGNMYTISFDFTNAKKSIVTGLAFWEKNITNMRIFLVDPTSEESWSGTRTIKFVSIEFGD